MRIAVVVAFCLAALLATAQEAPFGEVLEVGLTSVDVVVTDRDGKPVTGLGSADFEVFEDGKPQVVTNFSEVRGQGSAFVLPGGAAAKESAAAPQIPRKFIFYIDNATLTLENRKSVFPAIRKFVSTNLRAGDQAMLVTWSRELKVRVPWTADAAALTAGLDTVAGETVTSSYLDAERKRVERLLTKMEEESNEQIEGAGKKDDSMKPVWSELENAARGYAEAYKNDATHSMNALAKMLASLTGVDGKKVLVIATDTLPTVAGAEMFEHLDNIRHAVMANSSASSLKAEAAASSRVTDLSRYNIQPMLDVMARAANATGVTVYGINPKGLGGPASGKAEQQNAREANVDFARSDQALAGINLLANRTGGVAMVGAPADLALENIGRDLDAYYSLGYRAARGDSPERKIEVRSTHPGVKVRTRANVFYRSLEREMADRVIANHLQRELKNGLGVALQADSPTSDGSRQLLPVRVIIPVEMLTLLPDGKGNVRGGFSVFTCSGDGAGDASGVNVQSQAIHFTAEQAAQMKGRRIGFAIQVPIEKNRHQVSVGVLDHVSQEQGFATLKAAL